MHTVLTSFSPEGYEKYGKRFLETYREFWPWNVKLLVYTEHQDIKNFDCVDLLETEPCKTFLERYKDDLVVQGKAESPKSPWAPKDRAKGYSFRHDAYKFARKAFAITHAARTVKTGKLFWIDADVQTHAEVGDKWLNKLLPDDKSVCYLDRPGYSVESGFLGFNLNRHEAVDFISELERKYASGEFLSEKAWADGYMIMYLLDRTFVVKNRIDHRDRGQPFDNSILGSRMTHFKGRRKDAA